MDGILVHVHIKNGMFGGLANQRVLVRVHVDYKLEIHEPVHITFLV